MTDFDDVNVYTILLRVCKRYSVHPSSSLESEDFFRDLLNQYSGGEDIVTLEAWLEEQMPALFVALLSRPSWIQDPEWPFAAGKPMTFVGQIDYRKSSTEVTATTLHDDSSFYVFIAPKNPPKVVMQQA
jgi:hypothetical protein